MNYFILVPGLALGPVLLLAAMLALTRWRSLLDWLLFMLLCTAVALYLYLASPLWFWLGGAWRMVPPGIVLVATLWSARLLWCRPWLPLTSPRMRVHSAARMVATIVVAVLLLDFQRAGIAPADAIDLPLPLAVRNTPDLPDEGRFVILQGGGSLMLNRHRTVPAQAYAADIVALNHRGRRADGLRPRTLGAYRIFDQPVIAPCAGIVSSLMDGLPDEPIGRRSSQQPAGNHVLLSCVVNGLDITLLFAHLRSGSVTVSHGDRVRAGALLGRVGNSGNSTEPHLHIHGVRGRNLGLQAVLATAEAVPLTFAGRFPARNVIFHTPDPR